MVHRCRYRGQPVVSVSCRCCKYVSCMHPGIDMPVKISRCGPRCTLFASETLDRGGGADYDAERTKEGETDE
jgi:hypothetical protein